MRGAWDVYLKAQEIGHINTHQQTKVDLTVVADALQMDADIAEEYAISLQILELVQYDPEQKQICIA